MTSTFLLLVWCLLLSAESFSDIDSACNRDLTSSDTCPLPSQTNPFSCVSLTNDICGCNEKSIISNVVYIIDNTGFTNDYSWYYWSVEWIKTYQTKILMDQPSIAPNVVYIHSGANSSNYIITPNIDDSGDQINPNNIFDSWSIPDQYKNTNAIDFCASIEAAMETVTHTTNEDITTVVIYLVNSTPYYKENDTECANSLNNITAMYMLRSSPNVDIDHIRNDFSNIIKLETTMIETYTPNSTDDWGTTHNKTLVNEYMNNIVATASDFICDYSYLCDTIIYKSSDTTNECQITCDSQNMSCITDVDSSKYYITDSFSGMVSLEMSHFEANNLCNAHFETSLASLNTEKDTERIMELMNDLNVDECWIGFNDTTAMFMDINDIPYYQWMDGNINSFNKLEFDDEFNSNDSNSSAHCVSIADSGEWYLNECDEAQFSCAICNVMDDPVLTISDERNYLVYTNSTAKTWQQADDFCIQQFGTHLSTIQSITDERSVINNTQQMMQTISNTDEEQDLDIWIGTKILISYDECIDYWTRTFNIVYADGSQYNNYSLINLEDIIIETCTPTAAPTFSPSQAPTHSPTVPPTASPTNAPTTSPTHSPTRSPSNAPTNAPTSPPTNSPTRSPTASPTSVTANPTLSPTSPTTSPTQFQPTPWIPVALPAYIDTNDDTPHYSYKYYSYGYVPGSETPDYPTAPPTPQPAPAPVESFLTQPPTTAPKKSLQSPMEPSIAPTRSPTLSPVYASDQCLSLLSSRIQVNNSVIPDAYEYEHTWITLDCDAIFLSMFSCNKYDRAKYQALDTNYYVFIDDDGITWTDANDYCRNILGTSLSTIYDENDQYEIVDLKNDLIDANDIDISYIDDMWIGMKLDDGNFAHSRLSWSDYSLSNYSNLISGCLAIDNNNDSLWSIDLCDGNSINHIWSCNNFVPTPNPTVSPTSMYVVQQEQSSMFEQIAEFVVGHPFEIMYVTVLLTSAVVTFFAWIHAKSGTCCWGKCACFGYSDNAKYIAALIFGFQLWDFFSDVSFAYNLPDKMSSPIFYLSVIFIVVPWTINIIYLLLFRYRWAYNREVASWLREHTYKLVGMTMVCGGAHPSIELANSRIFALELFSMGLSRYQLIQSSKFKVMLTTVLENIPQIFITSYYMISLHHTNDFAIASLISSTCSVILVIVATILMRADNLLDEPMEIVLHYKFSTKDKQKRSKISRIGLHTSMAKAIANAIGIDEHMVFVDKHTVALKTATLNVSLTRVRTKEEMEQEEDEEEEEELISKTSSLYGLNRNDCKQIVDGILRVMGLNHNELRVSKMEIWPLDYNGARGFLSKVTHFDRHHRVNETKWEFPDNPLLAQRYQLLDTDDGGKGDHKADEDIKEEHDEQVGLLVDSD